MLIDKVLSFVGLDEEESSRKINNLIVNNVCLDVLSLQIRLLELKEARRLVTIQMQPNNNRSCDTIIKVLNEHIELLHQYINKLDSDSLSGDKIWLLYLELFDMEYIKPDYFSIIIYNLKQSIISLNDSNEKILIGCLGTLKHPRYYFSEKNQMKNDSSLQDILEQLNILVNNYSKSNDSRFMKVSEQLEELIELYSSFQRNTFSVNSRINPLLVGIDLVPCEISRDISYHMVNRTSTGDIIKVKKYSTVENITYIPNPIGKDYINPANEFAIRSLYNIFSFECIYPAILAKVDNLQFDNRNDLFGRVLQIQYRREGILFSDFILMCDSITLLEYLFNEKNLNKFFDRFLSNEIHFHQYLKDNNISIHEYNELSTNESSKRLYHLILNLMEQNNIEMNFVEFDGFEQHYVLQEFQSHIDNSNTCEFILRLVALIHNCQDLYTSSNMTKFSFSVLIVLCKTFKLIVSLFYSLSPEEIFNEVNSLLDKIDVDNFSSHFLINILTNPKSNQFKNYTAIMNQKTDGGVVSSISLTLVNSSEIFTQDDNIKTICYLLPSMNKPLSSKVKEILLKKPTEVIVFEYLISLELQNQKFINFEDNFLVKSDTIEFGCQSLKIPFEIPTFAISGMYSKLKKILELINLNQNITHWDILKNIQPRVLEKYKKAMKSLTKLGMYQQLGDNITTKGTSISPLDAANQFLKEIDINNIPSSYLLSFIGKGLQIFPSLSNNLNIPYSFEDIQSRRNIFFSAVENGYCSLVAKLLETEIYIIDDDTQKQVNLLEMRNSLERTPFLIACSKLDCNMIKLLLSYGANEKVLDINSMNCLIISASNWNDNPLGVSNAIQTICNNSYPPWNKGSGFCNWTVLHHLLENGNSSLNILEPLIEYLTNKGCLIDKIDNLGKTPLDYALEKENIRLVSFLISIGAGRIINMKILNSFIEKYPDSIEILKKLRKFSSKTKWCHSLDLLRKLSARDGVTLQGNQLGLIKLPIELESKIIYKENILNTSSRGRRNITSINIDEEHELFIKQYPEMPGIEYAVNTLFELIIGHGVCFTDLVKVRLRKGKSFPVLLSQGIKGDSLQDILDSPEDWKEISENLDENLFCNFVICSFLVNFEDAKPENIIVEQLPNGKYQFVAIDNDHAFVTPKSKRTNTILIKCILYCIDLMDKPIHFKTKEYFLSLKPAKILKEWINRLIETSNQYNGLFTTAEKRLLFDNSISDNGSIIGIPFKGGMIVDIYQKLQCIQNGLNLSNNITLLQLLKLTIPEVGIVYEEAFHSYSTPLERFSSLFEEQYSKEENGRFNTLSNSKQLLSSMQVSKDLLRDYELSKSPIIALEELKKIQDEIHLSSSLAIRIRQNLTEGNFELFDTLLLDSEKEKILNGTEKFDPLELSRYSSRSTRNTFFSHLLLNGNYSRIKLYGCSFFAMDKLKSLLQSSQQLVYLEIKSSYMTDKMVKILSKSEYLSTLKLSHIPMLLKDIIFPMKNLTTLEITHCQMITSITIPNTLKTLVLDNCKNISKVSVMDYTMDTPKDDLHFKVSKLYLNSCTSHYLFKVFKDYFSSQSIQELCLENSYASTLLHVNQLAEIVEQHSHSYLLQACIMKYFNLSFEEMNSYFTLNSIELIQLRNIIDSNFICTKFEKEVKYNLEYIENLDLNVSNWNCYSVLKFCINVKSIRCRGCDIIKLTDNVLSIPSVHELEIIGSFNMQNIHGILKVFDNLQKIILEQCSLKDLGNSMNSNSYIPIPLNSLKLINCYNASNTDIETILEKHPMLKELTLTHITNDTILKYISTFCISLEYLNISSSKVTSEGLDLLLNCSSITNLDISNCKSILDTFQISRLFNTLPLKHLNIHGTQISVENSTLITSLYSISFSALSIPTSLNIQSILTSITIVDGICNDTNASWIIQSSPNLTSLSICNCKMLTDEFLRCLSKCTKLEVLSIEDCNFSDEGMYSSLIHLKYLKKIRIKNTNVSDNTIHQMLLNSNQIQELDLSMNNELTDRFLSNSIKLDELEFVCLENCPGISSQGINLLLHNSKKLISARIKWEENYKPKMIHNPFTRIYLDTVEFSKSDNISHKLKIVLIGDSNVGCSS